MIVVRRWKGRPERFAVCGFFIRPARTEARRSWLAGSLGVGNPGRWSAREIIGRFDREVEALEVSKRPTSPLEPAACCTTVRPLWPGCTVPAIRCTKRCGCWVWRTAWCYQKSQARGVGVILWILLLFLLSSSVWTSSKPESTVWRKIQS